MQVDPIFVKYFWVGKEKTPGFDVLVNRLYEGKEVLKDISSYLQARHDIEINYSKALLSLAKTNPASKEIGSLATAITSLNSETIAVAKKHESFASKLSGEVCKPIMSFKDGQKAARKRLATEAEKCKKDFTAVRSKYEKAKEKYESLTKQIDQLNQVSAGKPDVSQKNASKLEKLTKEHQQTENECQTLVIELNTFQAKNIDFLTNAYNEIQTLEQVRYDFSQTMLQKYITITRNLDAEVTAELVTAHVIDKEADLLLFAETKGTGTAKPTPYEFISVSGNKTPPLSSTSKTSTPSNSNNNNNNNNNSNNNNNNTTIAESSSSSSSSSNSQQKPPPPPPSSSSSAAAAAAESAEIAKITTNQDQQVAPPQQKQHWRSSVRWGAPTQPTTTNGTTAATITTVTTTNDDPVSVIITGSATTIPRTNVTATLEQKSTEAELGSTVVAKPEQKIDHYKAIYGYDAEDESELSFSKTDVLEVLEKDDSGGIVV